MSHLSQLEYEEATPEAQPPVDVRPHRPFQWYLCGLLFLAVLYFMVPYVTVRTMDYLRWSGSPVGRAIERGFVTSGIDADVLVVGDSSALVGFDPAVLSRDLGLKVVNLAQTVQSYSVSVDLELQSYLAHNRRPKLILFYVSPWDVDAAEVTSHSAYDGEEMLVRHGSVADLWKLAQQRPRDIGTFPAVFYEMQVLKPNRKMELVSPDGMMRNFHGQPLPDKCSIEFSDESLAKRLSSFAGMKAELAKYRAFGIATALFVAPVPDCQHADEAERADWAQVGAAPPRVLPAKVFVDDGAYAHIDASAVPQNTVKVEAAMRAALGK